MIREVMLGGFQGFARDKSHLAPLGQLTLIYGPNASGKSSILRALKLVSQSIQNESGSEKREPNFIFEGNKISLASFANVSHRHSTSEHISVGVTLDTLHASNRFDGLADLFSSVRIEWEIEDPGFISGLSLHFQSRDGSHDFEIGFNSSYIEGQFDFDYVDGSLSQLGRLVDHPNYSRHLPVLPKVYRDDSLEKREMEWAYEAALSEVHEGYGLDEALAHMDFDWRGIFPKASAPSGHVPSSARNWVQELIDNEPNALDAMFLDFKFRLISSLFDMVRDIGSRTFAGLTSVAPLRDIQARLSFAKPSSADAWEPAFARHHKLEEQVSSWLEGLTEGRFSYVVERFVPEKMSIFGGLESAQVVDNLTKTNVAFKDVGVGLSQVLPILQALAGPFIQGGAGATVLVEQPELHLHPRMQADLAELFVDVVRGRRVQIIAETHSEAMLLRVQKCLREGKISPSDVQILYVEAEDTKHASDRVAQQVVTDYQEMDMKTSSIRNIPLRHEDEFEVDLPQSFAGLRLSEYL